MDFTFTEDQLLFREAIGRFLSTEASPENLRDIWSNEQAPIDNLLEQICAQGLSALSIPEANGGLGMGDIAWSLMTQELGYYAVVDQLADAAYVGAGLISALPNTVALKAEYLDKICEGKLRLAIGHECSPLVADAQLAGVLLMQHNNEVHIVSPDNVRITPNASIDTSRRLAQVDWQPSDKTCAASGEEGQIIWQETLNRGALSVAGQLLGLAQRMLDLSVEYSLQRKQFGKEIGSFQAVKHQLADVAGKIEIAKPVLYRAACSLENKHPLSDIHVSQARNFCNDAAALAARHSIQVHGAMGYTWEVDLQMYMKRSWALNNTWGDSTCHQARVQNYVLNTDVDLAPSKTFEVMS
ncbi:acyl-CoA dehydrogenase family protein [Aliiglaciecola lipolytica]|uniref:Acyl-CoA dehydrogenase domain protein n=1 Tax=Aliiglaciecola lipolytica E3 TaxID=1127673 RepID=K6YRN1_9ALTE|nr:acyl-CoA dehydrogenase family protein [Aliiglaciecola lipolytica]GAC13980.1 acyl-CoA dehydrogenase domain protein [Aliiglaciecola lipolytica E3]